VPRISRALPLTAFVLAVVGLVLLVVEVVRTLNGSALGTLGTVVLWAGVGLIIVAIVLLTMTLLSDSTETSADASADAGLAAESHPVS